jgi:hypothetical protein
MHATRANGEEFVTIARVAGIWHKPGFERVGFTLRITCVTPPAPKSLTFAPVACVCQKRDACRPLRPANSRRRLGGVRAAYYAALIGSVDGAFGRVTP